MQFSEKNCGGIELHLDKDERELVYEAFLCYTAHGDKNPKVKDEMPKLCEILQVLHLPEFAENEEIKDQDTSNEEKQDIIDKLDDVISNLAALNDTFCVINEHFLHSPYAEYIRADSLTMPIIQFEELVTKADMLIDELARN